MLGDDEQAAFSTFPIVVVHQGLGRERRASSAGSPGGGRSVADIIRSNLEEASLGPDDAAGLAAILDEFATMRPSPTVGNEVVIVTDPMNPSSDDPTPLDIALSRPAVADVLAAAVDALSVREVPTAAWLHRLFDNWLQRQPTGQRVLDATPVPSP
jgi:hypothetical protein